MGIDCIRTALGVAVLPIVDTWRVRVGHDFAAKPPTQVNSIAVYDTTVHLGTVDVAYVQPPSFQELLQRVSTSSPHRRTLAVTYRKPSIVLRLEYRTGLDGYCSRLLLLLAGQSLQGQVARMAIDAEVEGRDSTSEVSCTLPLPDVAEVSPGVEIQDVAVDSAGRCSRVVDAAGATAGPVGDDADDAAKR